MSHPTPTARLDGVRSGGFGDHVLADGYPFADAAREDERLDDNGAKRG